jgi:hypothetical protein
VEGDPVNYNDPSGLATCILIDYIDDAQGKRGNVRCASAGGSNYEYRWINLSSRDGGAATRYAEQTFGLELDIQEWQDTTNAAAEVRGRIRRGQLSSNCVEVLNHIGRAGENESGVQRAIRGAFEAKFVNGLEDLSTRDRFSRMPNLYATVNPLTNEVFLRPGLEKTARRDYFEGTILHEILHVTGVTDTDIRRGLIDAGFGARLANREDSGIFSEIFTEQCFK